MGTVAAPPSTVAGPGNQVISTDPLLNTDSPAYFQSNIPVMIGNSGTVAANANLGNLTLGTALDAVYGPTNNNCPGIWLYLPSTALAAPYNVAGWYWAVMTSTTVGTVYTSQPLNGGLSQAAIPSTQLAATNPFSTGAQTGYSFNFAPPTGTLTIATGSGSGYTGVTTATPASVYALPGGTLAPTGSLQFNGTTSANNSAGAKTLRGVVASAATLATGNVTIGSQALTTGISATGALGQVLMNGTTSTLLTPLENSWRYVAAGSAPAFGSLDFSGTVYAGFTMQVAVATDWLIAHLQNMTISQN
jgi:hypothetical protein